jgi:hypothetical protein
MAQRNANALAHTVDADKWARIREAERVNYSGGAGAHTRNWKEGATYACPELQHRSRGKNTTSIVLGKRVEVK